MEESARNNFEAISEEQDSAAISEDLDEVNDESEDIDEWQDENEYMGRGCRCERHPLVYFKAWSYTSRYDINWQSIAYYNRS